MALLAVEIAISLNSGVTLGPWAAIKRAKASFKSVIISISYIIAHYGNLYTP